MLDVLVCPLCKGVLRPSASQARKQWICAPCGQAYRIAVGIPSFFPEPHPFPLEFLPPEDILPEPPEGAFSLRVRRHTNGLQRALQYYGKAEFMRAVRRAQRQSLESRNRALPPSRNRFLDPREIQRAYRHSRREFIRRVMEPVMKRRFWTDERCLAMAEIVRDFQPRRLLDLATGPGGVLFRALPSLRKTRAIGLDIRLESCRTAMAEAEYFGLPGRVTMIHGDARLMPFASGTFDLISGWTAAYHISRYENVIQECSRVLKRRGLFVGTFHTKYPLHGQERLTLAEEQEFIRCAHLPADIREVCRVLKQCGFSIMDKQSIWDSHLIVAEKTMSSRTRRCTPTRRRRRAGDR